MSQTKTRREKKRQLGQFLTPLACASGVLSDITFQRTDTVFEPCFGDGSFLIPLIEKFLPLYDGPLHQRLDHIFAQNLYGIEIDPLLYARSFQRIADRWGYHPSHHHLVLGDFFQHWFTLESDSVVSATPPLQPLRQFDYIVGNPPFGGTIDPRIQDLLDRQFGFRDGDKIKKETYAFFIVKCLDLLAKQGRLRFICSDTFLTIPTMRGLRRLLMRHGQISVQTLQSFSNETNHAMVVLDFQRGSSAKQITLNGRTITAETIALTGNHSWRITEDLAAYFRGPKLGDVIVASSGMTTGKNDFFLRPITAGTIIEPYEFEYFEDTISLEKELRRARLGKLSPYKRAQIEQLERSGATRRNIRIRLRPEPLLITLPHPDYQPYNKAQKAIVYAEPTHMIYWKDDGDAVRTFKRNGNWYLHGVGGQRFFGREGITWQLIAQRLNMRYLPPGYVLDSGAPAAFLRPGFDQDELFFILAWALTPLCERILKEVVNHTKNIQSKDFERLPYPFWVTGAQKQQIITMMRDMVAAARAGRVVSRTDADMLHLYTLFDATDLALTHPTS